MFKRLFREPKPENETAIEAEKLVNEESVQRAKNAQSRLQAILDQMIQTNEERNDA